VDTMYTAPITLANYIIRLLHILLFLLSIKYVFKVPNLFFVIGTLNNSFIIRLRSLLIGIENAEIEIQTILRVKK
ncbi:hypothetical protein ACSG5Z_30795, partial [Bacillus sp. 'calajunan']